MKCPKCNAKFGETKLIATLEALREFAHRKLSNPIKAEHILYLNGEYRCTKCGHKLSEREAYLECV